MSDAPYIPFYTSDFLGGTSGMTAATKGIYITLLCLMYEAEQPLHQKWDTLARRCGCTLPAFKKAVEALSDDGKLIVQDGTLWSNKCDKHLTRRGERRSSAKAAAKTRWRKSVEKQGGDDADAMRTQCQPEPEPEKENKFSLGDEDFLRAVGERHAARHEARRMDRNEGEGNVVSLPARLDGSAGGT